MRKLLLFLLMGLFVSTQVMAQDRTISGSVTSSEDGSTLPGVTVVLKGTTIGTTTDFDGNYKLSVPTDGGTLVFSFVGMSTTEVEIGARSVIDLVMESDAQQLSEVVVTAMGVSREERSLGYSVQNVSGEQISATPQQNVVSALTGVASGVQITTASGAVGSSARVTIRGVTSLQEGKNQPLFVIDGVPVSNSSSTVDQWGGPDFGNALSDMNPNDIENISVLKGGAAAALYGNRAANGVILITTKTGKGKKGLGIEVNSSLTFDNVYILPKYQNKYGQGATGSEYGFESVYKANGWVPADLSYKDWVENGPYAPFRYVDGEGGGRRDNVDESWGPRLDQGFLIDQFHGAAQPWVSHPDNVKDYFDTGVTRDNSVALTFNNELANVRFSVNNFKQTGAVPNTDLEKNTVSMSTNVKLNNFLTVQAQGTYVKNHSDNLPGGGYDANNPMQQTIWFGRQVDVNLLRENWNTTGSNGRPYNWNTNYHDNPYWIVHNRTYERDRDRVFGNFGFKAKVNDWANVNFRLGTDFYRERRKATDMDKSIGINTGGSFWENNEFKQETNVDLYIDGEKDFDQISLSYMVGYNSRKNTSQWDQVVGSQLTVPNFFHVSNIQGTPTLSQWISEFRAEGVYGTVSVGYGGFVFLDISGRNDWSSSLPEDNWSIFYPSIATGFVFTDAFNLSSSLLSFGKLRASWAKVGNGTDPYSLVPSYVAQSPGFNGNSQYRYSRSLPPINLKPEFTTTIELGADLRFLEDRIGFDFTWYKANSTDLIIPVDVSPTTGFTSYKTNAGELENSGIELSLNAGIIRNSDGFNWDVTLNWSKNETKVVSLIEGLESYQLGSSWNTVRVLAEPGKKYGNIYGGAFKEDDQGRIVVGANGIPLTEDVDGGIVKIGNIQPDWIGSMRNTFSYKGIYATIFIDARKGGDTFSVTDWFGKYAGVLEETAAGDIRENGFVVPNSVLEDGSPNDIVVSSQNYYKSYWGRHKQSMADGSYVKLREVSIGYTLPADISSKIKAQSIRVSFVGRNLAILYRDASARHIDPETGFGASESGQGIEQMQIPSTRSLGFNLNVKF